MERINLDHWFVKENKLSISTMNHYVDITVCKNDKDIFYRLKVVDGKRKEIVFNFYTLEDAIAFTEQTIAKSRTNEEILNKYVDQFESDRFKSPISKFKDNKKDLSVDEVHEAIAGYYGEGKSYQVEATHELSLSNNHLDIHFFLLETFDVNGIEHTTKTMLTEGDLKNVFQDYAEKADYDLVNFKYIGGIRKVGYFVDEDTPHFDGIELSVKPREKQVQYKKEKR